MNEAFFTPIEDCVKVSSTFGQDFAQRGKLLYLENNLVPPRFPDELRNDILLDLVPLSLEPSDCLNRL